MKAIIIIILTIFPFLSVFGQNEETKTNKSAYLVRDSIQDSIIKNAPLENNSNIFNQKIDFTEKPTDNVQLNSLHILFIFLIVIGLIAGYIRVWTYKNAKQLEEGKKELNLFQAVFECILSFDFLWIIPLRNNYRDKHARIMDKFSKALLYVHYASLIATMIIGYFLPKTNI